MRVVEKYTSVFSANLAKGLLESHGINAMVLNENLSVITGVMNTDLISVELAVSDEDYSRASKLLAASSNAE